MTRSAITLGQSAVSMVAWYEQGPLVSNAHQATPSPGRYSFDASRFCELGYSDSEIQEIGCALRGANRPR